MHSLGGAHLIGKLARVTFGFSASEHAESLLGLVFGGGTINPSQLVKKCILGIVLGCVLTKNLLASWIKKIKVWLMICKNQLM